MTRRAFLFLWILFPFLLFPGLHMRREYFFLFFFHLSWGIKYLMPKKYLQSLPDTVEYSCRSQQMRIYCSPGFRGAGKRRKKVSMRLGPELFRGKKESSAGCDMKKLFLRSSGYLLELKNNLLREKYLQNPANVVYCVRWM